MRRRKFAITAIGALRNLLTPQVSQSFRPDAAVRPSVGSSLYAPRSVTPPMRGCRGVGEMEDGATVLPLSHAPIQFALPIIRAMPVRYLESVLSPVSNDAHPGCIPQR